jgi:hypothetical protein
LATALGGGGPLGQGCCLIGGGAGQIGGMSRPDDPEVVALVAELAALIAALRALVEAEAVARSGPYGGP